MAVTYTRFDKEPIILASYTGSILPEEADKTRNEVAAFKKEQGSDMVFRVIDFTRAKIDFSTVALGMAADRGEGGIDDPGVTTIFVGSGAMVKLGVDAFKEQKRYGVVNPIELVTSVDEALAIARARLV